MLASQRYGTLYTGVTSNLVGRIVQHRDDVFDGFTARHGIKLLVWYEVGDTMDAAIAGEKRIKRYRREWKIKMVEERNPYWEDLAVALGLPPL